MRLRRIPPLTPSEGFLLSVLALPAASAGAGGAEAGAADLQPPAGANRRFWREFLDLATGHHLTGYLHAHHRQARWWRTCPVSVQDALRQSHVQGCLRNQFYERELVRVVGALQGQGIQPVALKGAALNLTLYRDPGERVFADIDLLIRPEQVDAADQVMRALDFQLDERTQAATFYRAHHFHLIYRHVRRRWCCFELHWDLAIPCMDVRFGAGRLRRRAVEVPLASGSIRVPSPEDGLLHACLHASLGAFSNLAQVRDIHDLASRQDWLPEPGAFWKLAGEDRIATPSLVGLQLARLFGDTARLQLLLAPAPPSGHATAMRALLRPETILRRRLAASAAGSGLVSLLRRDRLGDRLRFVARQVRPSPADLGVEGHPVSPAVRADQRHLSWSGMGLVVKMGVYGLVTGCGGEIAPPGASGTGWWSAASSSQE